MMNDDAERVDLDRPPNPRKAGRAIRPTLTSSPRGRNSRACSPRAPLPVIGALAALTLLFPACIHAPRGDGCTLPGPAPWREYGSKHFVIDVAGWNRDPAHLVAAFEELHGAVLAALVAEPVEIPGRIRVVVLSSRRNVMDIIGQRNMAALFRVDRLGEPTILLAAEDVDDLPQIVAHELTHYLSLYLFPRQPYWFAEGLAQFMEGVAKVDREGRRWAGAAPASGPAAGSVKLTRVEDLFEGRSSELFDDPFLTSWVLYRFLWNERSKQFSDFQRRLSAGEAPADAWRAAFPEWEAATGAIRRLNNDLFHYQQAGPGLRWEVKAGDVDRTFTTAVPSPGDLHLVLLEIRLGAVNRLMHRRLMRETLEEALREDPGHPVATAELARLDALPLLPALRAVAAARPTDGRAWFLLGREAKEPAEREAALRQATELWPLGALGHAALASHLASTGRAREALPFANRGVYLAPWSPDAIAALAAVAVELGKCPEALLLQERAIDVARGCGVGSRASDPEGLKRQLAEYRKRCGAGGTEQGTSHAKRQDH